MEVHTWPVCVSFSLGTQSDEARANCTLGLKMASLINGLFVKPSNNFAFDIFSRSVRFQDDNCRLLRLLKRRRSNCLFRLGKSRLIVAVGSKMIKFVLLIISLCFLIRDVENVDADPLGYVAYCPCMGKFNVFI